MSALPYFFLDPDGNLVEFWSLAEEKLPEDPAVAPS